MKVIVTLKDENYYELILDNGDSLIVSRKANPREKLEQSLKLLKVDKIEWRMKKTSKEVLESVKHFRNIYATKKGKKMKYIRTKYGIYEYPDERFIKDNRVLMSNPYDSIKYMTYIEFTQADNIEELFDAFVWQEMVFAKIENNCLIEPSYEGLETPIDAEMIKEGIYGGIWTDKGFIYQAKMKGVLPNGEIDWEPLCLI